MIREDVTPRFLNYAMMATRVAAILETPVSQMRPSKRDSASLEDAKNFLKIAVDGRRVPEAGEVTERAIEASEAYGEAIGATIT